MPDMTRADWVARILAAPGDTATRLAFADWLEEQGEDATQLRRPGEWYLYWIAGPHGIPLSWWPRGQPDPSDQKIGHVPAHPACHCGHEAHHGLEVWRCPACHQEHRVRLEIAAYQRHREVPAHA